MMNYWHIEPDEGPLFKQLKSTEVAKIKATWDHREAHSESALNCATQHTCSRNGLFGLFQLCAVCARGYSFRSRLLY